MFIIHEYKQIRFQINGKAIAVYNQDMENHPLPLPNFGEWVSINGNMYTVKRIHHDYDNRILNYHLE